MDDVLSAVLGTRAADVAAIVIAAPLLYVTVIVLVRASGKRTTSQMNGFDWVVTVASGSLVASGILPGGASALEAAIALATLVAMQWGVTYAVSRSQAAQSAVKATPRLLLRNGEYLRDAMRAERVSEAEVRAQVRASGHTRVEDVEWVILETDASLSVALKTDRSDPRTALEGVAGAKGPDVEGGPHGPGEKAARRRVRRGPSGLIPLRRAGGGAARAPRSRLSRSMLRRLALKATSNASPSSGTPPTTKSSPELSAMRPIVRRSAPRRWARQTR